jgi:hypothetical protein
MKKDCGCNKLGSLGDSCDQETGQCECKQGVFGEKCSECENGYDLTADGCVSSKLFKFMKIISFLVIFHHLFLKNNLVKPKK